MVTVDDTKYQVRGWASSGEGRIGELAMTDQELTFCLKYLLWLSCQCRWETCFQCKHPHNNNPTTAPFSRPSLRASSQNSCD